MALRHAFGADSRSATCSAGKEVAPASSSVFTREFEFPVLQRAAALARCETAEAVEELVRRRSSTPSASASTSPIRCLRHAVYQHGQGQLFPLAGELHLSAACARASPRDARRSPRSSRVTSAWWLGQALGVRRLDLLLHRRLRPHPRDSWTACAPLCRGHRRGEAPGERGVDDRSGPTRSWAMPISPSRPVGEPSKAGSRPGRSGRVLYRLARRGLPRGRLTRVRPSTSSRTASAGSSS